MTRKHLLNTVQSYLTLGQGDWRLQLVGQQQKQHLSRHAEIQKAFRQNERVVELLDYRQKKSETSDISETDSVENEDALKLMRMIIGGYVDDDFTTYLSYNDFQEKKEQFGVLKNIYQSIQKKYRSKRIQENKINFRSILLIVYLQENISKMSRFRVEELFNKNKIVW